MLGRAKHVHPGSGAYQSEKQELKLARSLCDSGSITNYRAPIIRKSRGGKLSAPLRSSRIAIDQAADLIGDGWTGVHISDQKNQIYWPDRFHQLYPVSNPTA